MIAADGSFHFAKVPPGKYTAVLTWGPYVQSMRLGAANIDGPALDLTHGFTGGALTVTASSATGQVGGVVANPAAPGARLLVRLVSDESPALDRGTLARPDGSFTIANIRPGRYKLFVMDPGASPALVIRTVLSDYADVTESIEIHPGDTLTRDLRRHAK
jgi:hypothetical protein